MDSLAGSNQFMGRIRSPYRLYIKDFSYWEKIFGMDVTEDIVLIVDAMENIAFG